MTQLLTHTMREGLAADLLSNVELDKDCWLWLGAVGKNHGYGVKQVLVHRLAYELMVGPIEQAMVLHHECETRRCINPSHLHQLSIDDNNRLAREAGRVHNHRERGTFARRGGDAQ